MYAENFEREGYTELDFISSMKMAVSILLHVLCTHVICTHVICYIVVTDNLATYMGYHPYSDWLFVPIGGEL